MQTLNLGACLMTFYLPVDFTPVLIQQEETIETLSLTKLRKISEITLQSFHQPQDIILSREDLEKVNYKSNKRAWSEQEDRVLVECRENKNMEWEDVAQVLNHRNPKMCYSRYKRLLESTKMAWRRKDDDKLKGLVEQLGENWKEIQKHFKHWNARQVREHYEYYLRPNLDGQRWTIEEDLRLIAFVNQHGKDWFKSQGFFPSKSLSHIKNRFYGKINKLNDQKLLKMRTKGV